MNYLFTLWRLCLARCFVFVAFQITKCYNTVKEGFWEQEA